MNALPQAGPAPLRPSARFMISHPAHWVALGFGSGLSPVAPGTVGTLWGWVSFIVLHMWLTDAQWALVLAAGFVIGWWACTVTARHLRQADPGSIVWDEILAFWLVLWLVTPAGGKSLFMTQLIAFALFRFFDAAKPGPVRWADRAFKGDGWKGAFGILFDDLIAAGCTLVVMAVGIAIVR